MSGSKSIDTINNIPPYPLTGNFTLSGSGGTSISNTSYGIVINSPANPITWYAVSTTPYNATILSGYVITANNINLVLPVITSGTALGSSIEIVINPNVTGTTISSQMGQQIYAPQGTNKTTFSLSSLEGNVSTTQTVNLIVSTSNVWIITNYNGSVS